MSSSASSSTSKNPLVTAKQNLCSSLTPTEWKAYLALLKQWFKRLITKETFDAEARKLCATSATSDRRCLQRHNEFLLAIFSTCQTLSTGGNSGGGVGVGGVAFASSAASSPAAIPSAAAVKFAVGTSVSSGGVLDASNASSSVVTDSAAPPPPKSTKIGVATNDGNSSATAASKTVSQTPSSSSVPSSNSAIAAAASTPLGGASPASHTSSSAASSLPPAAPNASPLRTLTSTSTPSPTQGGAGAGAAKPTKEGKRKPKPKKPKPNKISFHNNFTPTNPLAYCQQIVPKSPEEEQGLSFAYRDRTLPDSSLIHGRMLVAAWDVGLEIVDEAAVRFLQVAVETHVRALLLKLDVVSSATSDEEASAMARCGTSVGFKRRPRSPLSLIHLRDTLQRDKNVVASHTVYAINMERILNAFEHQTVEEEELDEEQNKDKERRFAAEQRQLLTGFW